MSNRLQLWNHLIEKDLPPDKLEEIRNDFPALAKQVDEANGTKKVEEKVSKRTKRKKKYDYNK